MRLLSDFTLSEIGELFAGNGLIRTSPYSQDEFPTGTGQRRDMAASYLAALDLSDENERIGLLRVFEDVLDRVDEDRAEQLARMLEVDGVGFESPTRIRADELRLPDTPPSRLDTALPDFTAITDIGVLREHAERIQAASLRADPPDAILAARELLETVCKLVCEDYDVEIPKSPNAGQLYNLAAKPLGLNAAAITGDDDASAASRKVLSGLVRVADGLGDLRTRAGRGHGRTTRSSARQRHADLATGAAATLAIFILDTWQERRQADGQ